MSVPEPSSDYLKVIVKALQKRSKAIKHSVISFDYSIEIDAVSGKKYERFNLEYELARIGSSIRVSFWEDRLVFINVRNKLSSGKYYNCKIEGRLGETEGTTIIRNLEDTIKYSSRYEGSELDVKMKMIWDELVFTESK